MPFQKADSQYVFSVIFIFFIIKANYNLRKNKKIKKKFMTENQAACIHVSNILCTID